MAAPGFPPLPLNTTGLPHDNFGPNLDIAAWTLTSLATGFLGLRVYCKYLGGRSLWWDDYVLIAAWAALVANCTLVSILVSRGFGRHTWDLTPEQLASFGTVFLVRVTMTITAVSWSKTSFAITVLRIAETRRMRCLLWFIIITINLAMGAAAILGWTSCTPLAKTWDQSIPGTCWPLSTLEAVNVFAGIYSGSMDIVLALLPWKIIWSLQMKPKEKIGVTIAMSMAVFAGITSFIKTYKLKALESFDIYDSADLTMWDLGESAITIMAASIPVLRVLVGQVTMATRRIYDSTWTTRTRNRDVQSPPPTKGFMIENDDRSEKDIVINTGKA